MHINISISQQTLTVWGNDAGRDESRPYTAEEAARRGVIHHALSNQAFNAVESQPIQAIAQYAISTAKNGIGCEKNSGCTPLGRHIIRAKIGMGEPINSVFVGRRPTGEICTPELIAEFPTRDWILTRILWLSGLEVGVNRLGNQDTMQRYIYIHGSPDSAEMGVAGSHGCVRMRNQDIVELFDMVEVGTTVLISEDHVGARFIAPKETAN